MPKIEKPEQDKEKKRFCIQCKAPLSIYNKGNKCLSHSVKENSRRFNQPYLSGIIPTANLRRRNFPHGKRILPHTAEDE